MNARHILQWAAIGAGLLLVAAQFVPYGRDHAAPPGNVEPRWDGAETRALAARACFDCHSHATRWPWYGHVAPVSWLVQHDVDEGRAALNFSAWDRPQEEADEAAREVRRATMPMPIYVALHPTARLTADERERLARGLTATVGGGARGRETRDHDD